ncbi:hypothetical protein BC830DRAFT_647278 [Chytriomyces sp. MP71]|nr:hypothetical protein BC830DRAFT_647278 [Chytriomyces sp. MP71]
MFTMKAFDVGGRRKRRVAILLVCIVISLLLWLLQPPGGIGSRVPRIVYYNTHKGTRANMESIASRLELYLTHFDPSTLEGNVLASSQTAAQRLVDTGWANRFCANVDIVVIGDFFGYARPLLQSLFTSNESNRCTGAFFVAELTNRFNWNVTETGDLFAALAWNATRAGRLVWVENNPFEARHLADQAFITPEFRLMRPMGASNIEPLTLSAEDASLVAIFHDGKEFSPLRYVMEQLQVPHKVLRRKYGGARTLAKYKAVVELPYQVSTMKFYENLAAGVVMLIPSPAFYQELVLKNIVWLIPDNYFFRTGQPGDGPDWAAYMDYYHPTFTDYIYYFDSWEQLCDMASKDVIDVKNVRERAPVFYETVRHKTLNGWANLFNSFGFDVRVDGKKPTPDESAQGYKVLVPDAFQSNPEPSSLQEYKAAYESLKPWHAIRTDNLITLKFKAKKRLSSLDFGAAEYRRYLVHIPGDGVFKAFSPKFDSDASLRHLLDYLITVESSLSSSESLNLQPFAKEGLIQLLQMTLLQTPQLPKSFLKPSAIVYSQCGRTWRYCLNDCRGGFIFGYTRSIMISMASLIQTELIVGLSLSRIMTTSVSVTRC